MKRRVASSTHKKVVAVLGDGTSHRGYLNPTQIGQADPLDLLTPEGAHRLLGLKELKAVYFVRDFSEEFEPGRKAFLSRPKLDGLWVKLKFRNNETIEGVVSNDLLSMLDNGVQITPPDMQGQCTRIFIPRAALSEMTVLGVIGGARRKPVAVPAAVAEKQAKLFAEMEERK